MYRDVQIGAVLNGFCVQVGCQKVVFADVESMLFTLRRYYADPEAVEKEFTATAHAKHVPQVPRTAPALGQALYCGDTVTCGNEPGRT